MGRSWQDDTGTAKCPLVGTAGGVALEFKSPAGNLSLELKRRLLGQIMKFRIRDLENPFEKLVPCAVRGRK